MSLPPIIAVQYTPSGYNLRFPNRYHKAIQRALITTVKLTKDRMKEIVPQDTRNLLQQGISGLDKSLQKAVAGTSLKSQYNLVLDWSAVPYSHHVTEFPQSTTNWTMPGSQANFHNLLETFMQVVFPIQMKKELVLMERDINLMLLESLNVQIRAQLALLLNTQVIE